MQPKKVLISGAGIAGLTLAYWLKWYGFEPTVIERAPNVRGGGYMIDFWGVGFDVVDRMGLLDRVRAARYEIPFIEMTDPSGRVRSRLEIGALRKLLGDRHVNLMRSNLESILYESVKARVQFRFGTHITGLAEDDRGVEVELSSGESERFDLVVGADGLRSGTRRLAFGPDEKFERFLGYHVASFTIPSYLDQKDIFQLLTLPNKQVGLYAINDHQLATYFLFASPTNLGRLTVAERKQKLTEAFDGIGWRAPDLLARMEETSDFYFDAVSQIEMPNWSVGRVALVGDACHCVSLISGHGAALAMAGAYVLAGELARAKGDHSMAFARYEATLKQEMVRKQKMARRFASSFVPASRLGVFARDAFVNAMKLSVFSKLFVRRYLSDTVALPHYEQSQSAKLQRPSAGSSQARSGATV